jgi:hypothetical protein
MRPASNDRPAGMFTDCFKDPKALDGVSTELIASIKRLKASMSAETKLHLWTAN